MNKKSRYDKFGLVGLALLALVLVACGSVASAARSGSGDLRQILVEDVNVQIGVGSPIPIDIFVSGTWPDLCAQLAAIDKSMKGSQIELTLLATPAEENCPPDYVGVPFGIAIPLNGVELPPGEYTVTVNGVSTSFEWALAK